MPTADERKALFARRDLVNKLIAVAEEKGVSFYSLVNEIFESYLSIEALGLNLRRIVEELKFYKRANGAGFILVPKDLWLYAVKELYERNTDASIGRWFDVGVRLAKYYLSLGLENPLDVLVKDLKEVFRWVGEIAVHLGDSRAEVVVVGPELTEDLAKLLLELLKGVFNEYGYRLSKVFGNSRVVKAVFEK